MLDRLIIEFDKSLRTLLATPASQRPYPGAALPETLTEKQDKRHAAALMRVNHTGEICAQALYSAQAISVRSPETAAMLRATAQQGAEHLAWCEKRIKELGSHTSLLNPLFYGGSFGLGLLAGALGDRWSLGFAAENERQAGNQLARHLETLTADDQKSRTIISQLQADSASLAQLAAAQGATELPFPLKAGMRILSNIMTTTTYHL
ncbi:2-polyprenyl-3-methyl-6-methoxy-1,4-benzoquinone monooxygenase [Methylobacillus flagellatus]|uniref:2-polyprenyl-3-methyl-6-methoxy-1,4-benzoquinone monooxygenase n=1 Tax=Methylobacillus flagellatus TaxID=405 RepID=UPI002853FB55|nr:2-polyprenyl-3-methyl-6-methoxy-1,4-benzoquinone monooxygenase [Methylobacillus flagellatus]MDR5170424.1 2-polyprenyl-3-methyl-6-methoxy-1,4-benzoquinone monooxygenase [Methylobacillus flagellatus]